MEQRYLTEEMRDKAYLSYRQRGMRVRKLGQFSIDLTPNTTPQECRARFASSPIWNMAPDRHSQSRRNG